MIRFFKTLQPATLVIVPVIILLFWIRIIFQADPVSDSKILPLWQALSAMLMILPSWINFILLFGLISGEAIYLNLMLNRHEVLYKNTFIPALVFSILVSCMPGLMQFHPVHFINIILLLIIDRAFALFKNEFPVSALFDCGFLAGIAALIYFPAIILIPLLLTTLLVLRSFSIKEWMITFIGIILPYFFVSVYMFWNHNIVGFWKKYIDSFSKLNSQIDFENNLKVNVLAAYILIILFFSLLKLRINFRKNVIRTRNNQFIFFILLIFSVGWLMLAEKIEIVHFAFLVIPVTVFCSYLFVSAKKKVWVYEYMLWGLIAVILWNHLD